MMWAAPREVIDLYAQDNPPHIYSFARLAVLKEGGSAAASAAARRVLEKRPDDQEVENALIEDLTNSEGGIVKKCVNE
jgi:hypothetical protein